MPTSPRAAGIRLVASLLACATCAPALAQQVEVAAAVSKTTGGEYTQAASIAWLPELRPMADAILRAEIGAIHVAGRDGTPGRDLGGDVFVGHVGLRYERTDNGLTLGAGVGVQAGESDALSGDPQFVTTAGWRWQRFSLLLRHVSNASLHAPNDGETMLMAAWRF